MRHTSSQKLLLGLSMTCLASIAPLGMLNNGIALGQTVEQQTAFRTSALNEHNAKRAIYPIQPLTLAGNADPLSTGSQTWAEHLALIGKLEHSSSTERNGAGENIFVAYDTDAVSAAKIGKDASDSWYSEVGNYDYANPKFNASTGHFTQVVWKDTTTLGCGYAVGTATIAGNTYNAYYAVCRYTPAGNVEGNFPANVLPPNPGMFSGG